MFDRRWAAISRQDSDVGIVTSSTPLPSISKSSPS